MPSIHEADDLTQTSCPKIAVYGETGTGKTSLLLEFPDLFLLSLENGIPKGGSVKGFGPDRLPDFAAVVDTLRSLYEDPHDYRTVGIDSASKLEPIIKAEVCVRGRVKSIEDMGFGKGYVLAAELLAEIVAWLEAINSLGITVVILAHSTIKPFNDPETVSYDKYQINLDKRFVDQIQQFTDCILFIKKDAKVEKDDDNSKFNNRVHVEGGQVRWIYTDGKAAFTAKNRYEMPNRILYERGKGYEKLAQYLYG
jgi:hypothetical protein